MHPPLSLSLSLSFPHLTGTLCSEISHRVMLMEKDGGGGVWGLSDGGGGRVFERETMPPQ